MPFVLKEVHAEKKIKLFIFLMKKFGFTQRETQRYISKGRVFQNGLTIMDSSALIEGAFECVIFEPISRGLMPIFQTNSFALFDKPSGVLVHPQNRQTQYCMIDEIRYHFGNSSNIAHRIDQETSGLLVASLNKKAEIKLKSMFENREIKKGYLALVHGNLSDPMEIDLPILRSNSDSSLLRMSVKIDKKGKSAQTNIEPIKYYQDSDMTLIHASPHTGRQHQIRVHLFHVKHPIVGDPIYGQSEEDMVRFLDKQLSSSERLLKSGSDRLMLHAESIEFTLDNCCYKLKSRSSFIDRVESVVNQQSKSVCSKTHLAHI